MLSARPLSGTTNEDWTLDFHFTNHSSVLEEHHQRVQSTCVLTRPLAKANVASHQTNKKNMENLCRNVLIATSTLTAITTFDRSKHDFLHLYHFHVRHVTWHRQKTKGGPRPNEATKAEHMDAHDRTDSTIDIM
jgi:hypothetical protein